MSEENSEGIKSWASQLGTSFSAALSAALKRQMRLWWDVRMLASSPDDSSASNRHRALLVEHQDDPKYAADLLKEIRLKIASDESAPSLAVYRRPSRAKLSPAENMLSLVQETLETNRQNRLARLHHLLLAFDPGPRRPGFARASKPNRLRKVMSSADSTSPRFRDLHADIATAFEGTSSAVGFAAPSSNKAARKAGEDPSGPRLRGEKGSGKKSGRQMSKKTKKKAILPDFLDDSPP